MAELNVVICDGYDKEVFERVLGRYAGLRTVRDSLSRLLPHAEALLLDVFCCVFKMTTVIRGSRELSSAVLMNRTIVQTVLDSAGLAALRARTQLDESQAAVATTLLAERILEGLKTSFQNKPRELLDALETARDEEQLAQVHRERSHLDDSDAFDSTAKEQLDDELGEEIDALDKRMAQHRRRQAKAAKTAEKMAEDVSSAIDALPTKLTQADEFSRSFSAGDAQAGVNADERLELGERVMRSDKLRRLARLLGAFREVAFEARRRRVVRSPQETHSIGLGRELDRLLPGELLGLRSSRQAPAVTGLRLEFLRKYAENQLLHYELKSAASRGPMVVCLDGSGSMQGAKELWGKAVALTLMEIARRERRRCLAIIFSADVALFELDLLAKRSFGARAGVQSAEVVKFAEHFPGGGTDFEPPLARAVEAVSTGDFRRGDIVFITDGHAPVSDELVKSIAQSRRRHDFKIRGVVVDVGDHEVRELQRFADEVRCVSDLATDSLTDLFAAV